MGLLFFMLGGFMTVMTLIVGNMWITGGFGMFTLYATIVGFKADFKNKEDKEK